MVASLERLHLYGCVAAFQPWDMPAFHAPSRNATAAAHQQPLDHFQTSHTSHWTVVTPHHEHQVIHYTRRQHASHERDEHSPMLNLSRPFQSVFQAVQRARLRLPTLLQRVDKFRTLEEGKRDIELLSWR